MVKLVVVTYLLLICATVFAFGSDQKASASSFAPDPVFQITNLLRSIDLTKRMFEIP